MRTLITMQMFLRVKDLAGDAIELGVARGDTTFPLANLMRAFYNEKIQENV
jgi:hypothetical protein